MWDEAVWTRSLPVRLIAHQHLLSFYFVQQRLYSDSFLICAYFVGALKESEVLLRHIKDSNIRRIFFYCSFLCANTRVICSSMKWKVYSVTLVKSFYVIIMQILFALLDFNWVLYVVCRCYELTSALRCVSPLWCSRCFSDCLRCHGCRVSL